MAWSRNLENKSSLREHNIRSFGVMSCKIAKIKSKNRAGVQEKTEGNVIKNKKLQDRPINHELI